MSEASTHCTSYCRLPAIASRLHPCKAWEPGRSCASGQAAMKAWLLGLIVSLHSLQVALPEPFVHSLFGGCRACLSIQRQRRTGVKQRIDCQRLRCSGSSRGADNQHFGSRLEPHISLSLYVSLSVCFCLGFCKLRKRPKTIVAGNMGNLLSVEVADR